MKSIKLTRGKEALVDDDDFQFLSTFKWCAVFDSRHQLWYVNSVVGYMHRLITRAPKDVQVDHIDGNGLNNQKSNLRICSTSQNQMNRRTTSGTSRYKGVYWERSKKKWRAEIVYRKKRYRLGLFQSENEAALRYNVEAAKLFGEFAKPNVLLKLDRFFPDSYTPREQTKSSQHKGISFDKTRKKWISCFCSKGVKTKIGRFNTEQEALHALISYCVNLPESE